MWLSLVVLNTPNSPKISSKLSISNFFFSFFDMEALRCNSALRAFSSSSFALRMDSNREARWEAVSFVSSSSSSSDSDEEDATDCSSSTGGGCVGSSLCIYVI